MSFVENRPFLEVARGLVDGATTLFGVPYDGTTSFRPGTRFGPNAIRDASYGLETYSPLLDRDYTDTRVCELGDLDIPLGAPEPVLSRLAEVSRDLVDRHCRPLMLGGEHSLTPPVVHALLQAYPDLVVVQLDAHADLRESFLGSRNSHACAMRRCLDRLAPDALLQLGIRSGTREEFGEMRSSKRLLEVNGAALAARLDALGDRPIYVTVDLDVFDPSVLCGTGTPEPGGATFRDFESVARTLFGRRVVGADVMELAPHYDTSGVSSIVAARVVRELLVILGH